MRKWVDSNVTKVRTTPIKSVTDVLVRTDDTMRKAFQEILEVKESDSRIKDYRTAAYTIAIKKIAQNYTLTGM